MSSSEMPQPRTDVTLRCIVRGRVQGVGYRYFVIECAGRLGLDGRVRNLADGSVEVEARGARETLAGLVEELKQGPFLSKVAEVMVDWDIELPLFDGFDIDF